MISYPELALRAMVKAAEVRRQQHMEDRQQRHGAQPAASGAGGRKSYLFSKSDRGAEDNAIFYSLLESCAIV